VGATVLGLEVSTVEGGWVKPMGAEGAEVVGANEGNSVVGATTVEGDFVVGTVVVGVTVVGDKVLGKSWRERLCLEKQSLVPQW
jgi:hypothetical protein